MLATVFSFSVTERHKGSGSLLWFSNGCCGHHTFGWWVGNREKMRAQMLVHLFGISFGVVLIYGIWFLHGDVRCMDVCPEDFIVYGWPNNEPAFRTHPVEISTIVEYWYIFYASKISPKKPCSKSKTQRCVLNCFMILSIASYSTFAPCWGWSSPFPSCGCETSW